MKESYRQKPFLTLAAGAVAMALLLAGCGGGSSSTPTTPEPTPPPPPPGPTAESLKADAADAITKAAAAGMAADQAKKDAIKYAGMIDTASVSGDSAMATANAQKVLDAEMAANDAVMDADDALQAAMDAKTAAEALAADDPGRAGAITAADEAIKQAMAHKEAAMAIVDATETTAAGIDSLKGAVAAIKGADPTADGYPKMPAAFGQDVAMAIGAALGPTGAADGTGTRVTDETGAPADTIMTAVQKDDHQGMTWAEIVGADNVIDARLGTTSGGATTPVKAASVADMTLGTTQTATAADDTETDGTQIAGVTYMGIPGTAFCMGDDCRVEEIPDPAAPNTNLTDQRKLAGSWYFTPTSPMEYYVKAAGASAYSAEVNYARFGHWLTVAGDGNATIHTFAINGNTATNNTGLDVVTVNTAADATTLTDTSATYRGMAVGMSLHKEIDAQGNAVKGSLSSGAFTANVTLTAKFGTSPMLGGMINGFSSVNGGSNVDSAWSVKLPDTAFTGAALTGGVADASGQDGIWNATGYGTSGERPMGIFGDFNAHFTDGHAAGAYATRKVME